jgi:hypothetical protein
MRPVNSSAIPIYPGYIAKLSEPQFGTSPYKGFRGGNASGMRGMRGCGCASPSGSGCGCSGVGAYDPGRAVFARPGMNGMGNASLDQIISNAFNWLGGVVQSNLPASAAVPPQYGSGGAIGTELLQYVPYIIGGLIVYKLIK